MSGETAHSGPTEILWQGAIPRAAAFDDTYYSTDDPIGEVRHTFLDGVGFDDLARRPLLTVAETGFGTGLNFLEAWHRWTALAPPDGLFDFISVEAYPMAAGDLARAHGPFGHLAEAAAALRAQWPGAVPGWHRLRFAGGRVRLLLLIGEAGEALAESDFAADAWFLDGFAPARNPEMWRPAVLSAVARLSRPGTRAASFTAAGHVRRGLAEAGFSVVRRPGFGRKRDCLHAEMPERQAPPSPGESWSVPPSPAPRAARIAVVGDGIAGCAMTDALRRAGHAPLLIGGGPSRAYAASTLPRALIAPKLVRGEEPYGRFARQTYPDAVRFFDGLTPAVWCGPRGLLLPAPDDGTAAAQATLQETLRWPEAELRRVDAAEATALTGQSAPGGLYLARAGTVDPAALRRALTPEPHIRADVAGLARRGKDWSLRDADGAEIAAAEVVILCGGAGLTALLPRHRTAEGEDANVFALRRGAGHLARLRDGRPGGCAVMRDGYATGVEPDGTRIAGATALPHAPLAPVKTTGEAVEALRRRIAPLLAEAPQDASGLTEIWAGLRCDTADHLPLAGPVPDLAEILRRYDGLRHGRTPADSGPPPVLPGLWALGALGARGFQAAPLLADHLAALITGRPAPLPPPVARAVTPARTIIRALRRNAL
jgi:tRNA 5-methylaminomethyl-2-thiouridine biosynthesis bifunctional protein